MTAFWQTIALIGVAALTVGFLQNDYLVGAVGVGFIASGNAFGEAPKRGCNCGG